MANVTTTTAASLIPEMWSMDVELAAQEHRGFSGRIKEFPFSGPGDVLHIPTIGKISAAAFSGTVTYTANTEGSVDITPDVSYAAVQIDRKADVRAILALGPMYTAELGKGLAQYEDVQIAALYAGLSQSVGGASNFSKANHLLAIRTLIQSGKDKVIMGNSRIWGVIHPVQWDHVFGEAEIISANVRGDAGAGPAKLGTIDLAYGVTLDFSGNVQTTGSRAKNMYYTMDAFAIARKQTPTLDMDFAIDSLSNKLVASQDFGVAELNDGLGIVFETNDT